MKSTEKIFADIYKKNLWTNDKTASGNGSTLAATVNIREALPRILTEYKILSFLDLPCGDLHWMETVPLGNVEYVGCDIVPPLITGIRQIYPDRRFEVLNMLKDIIPEVDMIFCRDCLVHFSFADVRRAVASIIDSKSTYLMTTTFPVKERNRIIRTGSWTAYNLQVEPFNFPEPLTLVNEGCEESYPAFTDKSMGLWRIDDITHCMR